MFDKNSSLLLQLVMNHYNFYFGFVLADELISVLGGGWSADR